MTRRKTPAQLDREVAFALSKSSRDEDDVAGVFYLTENSPTSVSLGVPEFRTLLAAKRAAMRLVRDGRYRSVEVWRRWRGDNYMQGLANEDGWSDV